MSGSPTNRKGSVRLACSNVIPFDRLVVGPAGVMLSADFAVVLPCRLSGLPAIARTVSPTARMRSNVLRIARAVKADGFFFMLFLWFWVVTTYLIQILEAKVELSVFADARPKHWRHRCDRRP